jgi:hypothetical protein
MFYVPLLKYYNISLSIKFINKEKESFQLTRAVLLAALISTAIYVVHTAFLGSWIVDDAGISFAYARNLAEGHGLVAQPGAVPVEGFTNLLWVLLLSIPMKLHAFDPVLTPKIISAFCVALSFIWIGYLLYASGSRPAWLTACSLSISAGFTGFAVWGAAGLENALYALVVSMLAFVSSIRTNSERLRLLRSVAAGVVLFLVFCTRPDGALYFWILPFLMGTEEDSKRGHRPLVAYTAAFIVPWLLLTLFRLFYFNDVFPNTFYAKRGEGSKFVAWLLSHLPLYPAGIIIMIAGVLVIAAIAFGVYSLGRKMHRWAFAVHLNRYALGLFFVTSILVYDALRGDWMPDFRYATPAFLFGPAIFLAILWDISYRVRLRRLLAAALTVALVAAVGTYSFRQTSRFVKSPAISFASVREMTLRIAQTIEPLGSDVAVLTPDIGGALWENRYRVVDLAGLVDRAIGRTIGRDRQRIRDHLLKERKPEGVWLHSFWMRRTGFNADPAFAEMYAPVWEERSSPESPPTAGFYLRRDLALIGPDGRARPSPSFKKSPLSLSELPNWRWIPTRNSLPGVHE